MPPPQWGTPRRPDRPTLGAGVKLAAEVLGTPLHPAQQHVVDVALELDPETGTLVYNEVVITVHRQFGKTTLTLPRWIAKQRRWPDLTFIYTAQKRNNARRKLEDEFAKRLKRSGAYRAGVDFSERYAAGSERIKFSNGTQILIDATNKDSGHGEVIDEAVIDEAFTHTSMDVDQGFGVPMITRGKLARESRGRATPGPQKWIVSTKGDEDSLYLNTKIALGRAAVERGDDRGLCYIEWSCPEDWDIYDRSLWWWWMPGLGHTMAEEDVAREQASMAEPDWRRAFGNQTQKRSARESAIDPKAWAGQVDAESGIDGRLVFGVAMPEDRSEVGIGVAGERSRGGWHVEVVDEGSAYAAEDLDERAVARLVELVARHGAEGVAVDPGAPAGSLIGGLTAAGVTVHKLGAQRFAQACGAFHDGVVKDRDVWHRGQAALDDAVGGARRVVSGEAWKWDRRGEQSIVALEACTLALGAVQGLEPVVEEDSVYDDLEGFGEW